MVIISTVMCLKKKKLQIAQPTELLSIPKSINEPRTIASNRQKNICTRQKLLWALSPYYISYILLILNTFLI